MYKVWAVWQIVEAIILLAAGVFTIIFSNDVNLYKWIFIAISAFVILDGILRIMMPFFNKDPRDNTMFIGIFELTLGIVILLKSQDIIQVMMLFIGIILLVLAPVAIADGVIRIARRRESLFFPVVEFVSSLIFIAVGTIILYSINNYMMIVLIVIGVILLILAIVEISLTIRMLSKIKKRERTEEKLEREGIDTSVVVVSDIAEESKALPEKKK